MRLNSKNIADGPEEVISIERLIVFQADDVPTGFSEGFVAFGVPLDNFNLIVNTAVEFDDELCARDGEVDNHAFNRVLTADRVSMTSELAKNVPRSGLACGFVLSQASGTSFWIKGH